jgi:hypothetical protein
MGDSVGKFYEKQLETRFKRKLENTYSFDKEMEDNLRLKQSLLFSEEAEERQRIVEQNGNDGLHYEAEQRKEIPIFSGVLKYFPDALKEVAKCSFEGQKQHNQGEELYWDKTKSTDHEDAGLRHLMDHQTNPIDTDGRLHLGKYAWRALATLQIYLEKSRLIK